MDTKLGEYKLVPECPPDTDNYRRHYFSAIFTGAYNSNTTIFQMRYKKVGGGPSYTWRIQKNQFMGSLDFREIYLPNCDGRKEIAEMNVKDMEQGRYT